MEIIVGIFIVYVVIRGIGHLRHKQRMEEDFEYRCNVEEVQSDRRAREFWSKLNNK